VRSVVIAVAVALALGGCLRGCYFGCGEGYSDGDRVATVVKFSRKGVIWKSWEGEANLGRLVMNDKGGMVVDLFRFSVTSANVVAKVDAALEAQRPVRLVYRQWLWPPATQGSRYVITDVQPASGALP
jgi:hypothetical protein